MTKKLSRLLPIATALAAITITGYYATTVH